MLKLSYDNLIDKNMQKFFLYCTLYHKIDNKDRKELIMKFVDKGLINGMRSLEEIFDEGRTILDKLKGHSLLFEEKDEILWMHGLVRDMACYIVRDRYMVKCNEGLTKIPHMQEWTIDLEKVSLIENKIIEIPEGTLIFSHNLFHHIPDCFFSHMNALAILDLSYNRYITCLLNSVSNYFFVA